MNEVWKPITGFEGLYEVSNTGKVKSLGRYAQNHSKMQFRPERELKQNTDKKGYKSVALCKDGKTFPRSVHRLVAQAFIPNPENKPQIDHIDTNPSNNNVNNLRWATALENAKNPLSRNHNSNSKQGHPYWGRSLSQDEREKIRIANIGKKRSAETRKRLSESHKNSEKAVESSRKNIEKAIQSNIGRKCSEEKKEKIRNANKGLKKGKTWKLINGKRVWMEKEVILCG